jgi:natural product precursor
MKSKNLSKKLKLNKKTITHLSDNDLNTIRGGVPFTWRCPTTSAWICCV